MTQPIAYIFFADLYCADCGENLPDVDPEGNEKGAVFFGEADYVPHCANCGQRIEGYSLTGEGVAYTLEAVAHAAGRRELTGTIEEWAGILRDYQHGMRPGDRALIAAVWEGDEGAAHAIATLYLGHGAELPHVSLEDYWPC